MTAQEIKAELDGLAEPGAAAFAERFFKTGEGQYGAGDRFLGLKVPVVRAVCKKFQALSLAEIEKLLESPIHEHRLAALIIMTEQAKKAGPKLKKQLYDLYLRRTDRINNWDLVDVSCSTIVGDYLLNNPRDVLYKLARSPNIWERRIAIVTTLQFMRAGQFDDTFKLSEILLQDKQDLIHKAVGWMLREAGKYGARDQLVEFLNVHAYAMPRTMLRYSIEHFSPAERQRYLKQKQTHLI